MKLKKFEKKIKKLGYSIEVSHKGNLKVVTSEGKLILTVVVSKPMHYVKGSDIGRHTTAVEEKKLTDLADALTTAFNNKNHKFVKVREDTKTNKEGLKQMGFLTLLVTAILVFITEWDKRRRK